jgi:hypothetical protein
LRQTVKMAVIAGGLRLCPVYAQTQEFWAQLQAGPAGCVRDELGLRYSSGWCLSHRIAAAPRHAFSKSGSSLVPPQASALI